MEHKNIYTYRQHAVRMQRRTRSREIATDVALWIIGGVCAFLFGYLIRGC